MGLYFNENGIKLILGKEIGSGGEANVFELDSDKVAKIYKIAVTSGKLSKIKKMVEIGSKATFSNSYLIVFPLGLIFDEYKNVVGYYMKKISSNAQPLLNLTQPEKGRFMGYISYRDIMSIFLELAKALETLHKYNIYVTDFNLNNFFVDQNLMLYLLDTDNWAIQGVAPHEVYFNDYAPHDFNKASSYVDTYSYLFILYFFMFFAFPYIGKPRGVNSKQMAGMTLPWRKQHGQFFLAGSHNKQGKKIYLGQPESFSYFSEAHVSKDLRKIFVNVFGNEGDLNLYPQMKEIITALDNYIHKLRACSRVRNHYHYSNHCPWCSRSKAGFKEFNENETNFFQAANESILKKIQENMDDYLIVEKSSVLEKIKKLLK